MFITLRERSVTAAAEVSRGLATREIGEAYEILSIAKERWFCV